MEAVRDRWTGVLFFTFSCERSGVPFISEFCERLRDFHRIFTASSVRP